MIVFVTVSMMEGVIVRVVAVQFTAGIFCGRIAVAFAGSMVSGYRLPRKNRAP